MTQRDKLKSIIREHKLSRQQVAELMGVSVHTVNSWLAPEGSSNHTNCPEWRIKILVNKLLP